MVPGMNFENFLW